MTTAKVIEVEPAEVGPRLTAWFGRHARDLPWRRHRSPYATLVAEFMLQQTQARRVAERFDAFLARFPTVADLARATEQDVLDAWQGLGYYRRARHLHRAARDIVERFDGIVPATVDDLASLPGIGRYTAGAIASQAYGVRAPVVDGNVQRVLARLHARPGSATTPSRSKQDWAWATRLVTLTPAPAGVINEAIMELGATICTPRRPACTQCPLAACCRGHALGAPERFPAPQPRAARKVIHHHVVVVRRDARVLLEQRPGTGLWARLWQPPTVESPGTLDLAEVRARLPLPVTSIDRVGSFAHATTHRDVRFTVFRGTTRVRRGDWCHSADLPPMSNAHRRVLALA